MAQGQIGAEIGGALGEILAAVRRHPRRRPGFPGGPDFANQAFELSIKRLVPGHGGYASGDMSSSRRTPAAASAGIGPSGEAAHCPPQSCSSQ